MFYIVFDFAMAVIMLLYGKRMMLMSIPFIAGIIIDIWYIGIGCLIAWLIWFVMFILLLMDRHKRES